MKEIAVLIAGVFGWMGCLLGLVMPFRYFAILKTDEYAVLMVVLPLVIVNTIIWTLPFWSFYRAYKGVVDAGVSSPSELYQRLAFRFCMTPLITVGGVFFLVSLLTSIKG